MGSLNDEMIDDMMKHYIPDSDGFQNVQPPEGWVEEEQARVESLEDIQLGVIPDGLPQREDRVAVWFSPEELVILKEILEAYSCGGFCQSGLLS